MASSQQSNQLKKTEDTGEEANDLFDQDTREKSPEALLSLLTHLKRQDEESSSE